MIMTYGIYQDLIKVVIDFYSDVQVLISTSGPDQILISY